jgi:hypothetical protein
VKTSPVPIRGAGSARHVELAPKQLVFQLVLPGSRLAGALFDRFRGYRAPSNPRETGWVRFPASSILGGAREEETNTPRIYGDRRGSESLAPRQSAIPTTSSMSTIRSPDPRSSAFIRGSNRTAPELRKVVRRLWKIAVPV